MKSIVVIGAGASGLMAANAAAAAGGRVTVFEKNEKAGKKIYITGKGRCNFTNVCERQDFLENVADNPRFLYSALSSFSPKDCVSYFEKLGMKTKVERGRRAFPVSDHASDVTKALLRDAYEEKVDIRYDIAVKFVEAENGHVTGVRLGNGDFFPADTVIIATGGMSYPTTGSTGDGYRMAEALGHTVERTRPALTGLRTREDIFHELSGLTLKNIEVRLLVGGRQSYKGFGELLFTHDGVSGPLALTASFFAGDSEFGDKGDCVLSMDLKPAIGEEELDQRLQREFNGSPNMELKNVFPKLLPHSLSDALLKFGGADPQTKCCEVTKKMRRRLVGLLKDLRLTVDGIGGYNEAIITRGGVRVKELDPKTCGSKLIKGLYFAGEIIDVAAFTGGYNLHIAWATGKLAGESAARSDA